MRSNLVTIPETKCMMTASFDSKREGLLAKKYLP
jgi:hypothetical protein